MVSIRCLILLLTTLSVVLGSLPIARADESAGLELYESKIRPVLVKNCYSCHSVDAESKKKLKGGLLLDSRHGMLAGGDSGPAVVPNKVEESLILGALSHEDFEMPPSGKLPQNVIDDFTTWVKTGAAAPQGGPESAAREGINFEEAREFWSFKQPTKVPPPPTKNRTWPKSDIDRFILARLEAEGLQPVDLADERTLLRRATFDLTGLPPTPEEMQAFLSDANSDNAASAFSDVIDRLLESPHYGERWGRHWLDVARYAEDQAHTFGVSQRKHAHEYRDWVINALNNDMPYDQFVKMQLAGDLILGEETDSRDRLAGLGLLGLGAIYYKNSDKAQAQADELDDRIDTVTRGLLGLTVSCARCHDHKFDPIPTQDYYSLAGIFHNTRMVDKPLASKEVVETFRAAEKIVKDCEAQTLKYRNERKSDLAEQQRDKIAQYMTAVWTYRQRKAADKNTKIDAFAAEVGLKRKWIEKWNSYLSPNNKELNSIDSLDAWRKLPDADSKATVADAEVRAAAEAFQTHLNYCLDERDGKLPKETGDALFSSGRVDRSRPIVDIRVDISGSKKLFLVMTDAGDGDNSDWGDWLNPKLVNKSGEKSLLEIDWKTATTDHHSVHKNKNSAGQPLKVADKTYDIGIGTHSLSVIEYDLPQGFTHFVAQGGLDGSGAGSVEFRVYTTAPKDIERPKDSPAQRARKELVKKIFSEKGLFSVSDTELLEHLSDDQTKELEQLTAAFEDAKKKLPSPLPMAHVVMDSGVKNLNVYIRGNPSRQGDEAPRRFLRILSNDDREPYESGSGRLELANDIASADNPLTARVIVNRVWQHHFGRGLVGTASNFGEQGELPTHPELLDWLTVRFVETGWSLKWLHREIMLSSVYQLSSDHQSKAMQKDPENLLHWRMSRRRLEIESWRDALLSVAGNLDTTQGGPTVKLDDPKNYRRTVYGAISRHDLDGLLRLFDFPDANVTSAARTETTVPQQQLFVLNSDFFVLQAKALANRLHAEYKDDNTAKIHRAYQLLFGRSADPEELALGVEFVTQEKSSDDRLSPWEQYTQALLGSNEFMYID